MQALSARGYKPVSWSITIPGLPPTSNHLFISAGRFRVKSPEYRKYEQSVSRETSAKGQPADGPLHASIYLYSPNWFTKSGSIRKVDLANREKALLDAVAKAHPWFKDERIFKLSMYKLNSKEPKTVLILDPYIVAD